MVTVRDCGGCHGRGAHIRWCEQVVGRTASRWGYLSERAESMADGVGSNNPGAANHLYAAAGLLLEQATQVAGEWRTQHPEAPERDGTNP